jgi:tetraacyldisaccharide 4'-kinase
MKAPAFWSRPPGLLARLLAPLGLVYGAITAWRMGRSGARAAVPVICIGNLTAGGAGKTPTVQALARSLAAAGEIPFVVSRGYGGRLAGPVRVDAAAMTAADCGDEPLLLGRDAPVIVARDRAAGAAQAAREGATVILLDDGLQNPGLAKDISIAVVDGGAGFGNGFCIPAGPLRAPVAAQMRHVDALLVIGAVESDDLAADLRRQGKPVLRGALVPDPGAVAALADKPLLALAGIGRPAKFFETLRRAGLDVRETQAFADHHPYAEADIAAILKRAEANGLTPITTEKDAVRLPAGTGGIATFPVALAVADDALTRLVSAAAGRRRSGT